MAAASRKLVRASTSRAAPGGDEEVAHHEGAGRAAGERHQERHDGHRAGPLEEELARPQDARRQQVVDDGHRQDGHAEQDVDRRRGGGPRAADGDRHRGGRQEAVADQPDRRLGGEARDAAHVGRRVPLGRGDLEGDLAKVRGHEQVGVVATRQPPAEERRQHEDDQQQHVRDEGDGQQQLELGDGHTEASLVQLEDESPGIGAAPMVPPTRGTRHRADLTGGARTRPGRWPGAPSRRHCCASAASASLAP